MKVQNVLQNSPSFSGKIVLAPGLSDTTAIITKRVEAAMAAAPEDTVLSVYKASFPNVIGVGFKPREDADVFYSHGFTYKDSKTDKTVLSIIANGLNVLVGVKSL